MKKVIWIIELVYKLLKWVIINGIPFFRGLIEEWKQLRANNELKKYK